MAFIFCVIIRGARMHERRAVGPRNRRSDAILADADDDHARAAWAGVPTGAPSKNSTATPKPELGGGSGSGFACSTSTAALGTIAEAGAASSVQSSRSLSASYPTRVLECASVIATATSVRRWLPSRKEWRQRQIVWNPASSCNRHTDSSAPCAAAATSLACPVSAAMCLVFQNAGEIAGKMSPKMESIHGFVLCVKVQVTNTLHAAVVWLHTR